MFLGGSCNPTAWRRDQSIPLLEREGVTYYNPVREGEEGEEEGEREGRQEIMRWMFFFICISKSISGLQNLWTLRNKQNKLVVLAVSFICAYSSLPSLPPSPSLPLPPSLSHPSLPLPSLPLSSSLPLKNAISLLFVIDNQTRACSSLVETAYLIGRN